MSTTALRNLALVMIALAVSFTSAFAHEEKHEHLRERERAAHHERVERRVEHRRMEREHWQHERARREAEHRRHENHPNGWDHGRKTGWKGNNVPPGQIKPADHSRTNWTGSHVNTNHAPQNTKSTGTSNNSNVAKVMPVGHRR